MNMLKISNKARNFEKNSEHSYTFLQTVSWSPCSSWNLGLTDKGIDPVQWFLHCYDEPSLSLFLKKSKSMSLIASNMIVLSYLA